MVGISILQIRVATMFMLDPDIILLLTHLSRKGYATAFARLDLGGSSTVTPIMPPNVIAIKGNVRVDYDFSRRSLGVEGSNPQEVVYRDEKEKMMRFIENVVNMLIELLKKV